MVTPDTSSYSTVHYRNRLNLFVLPGLQGNIAVQEPVVLAAGGVLGAGGPLWSGCAVGGCRAGVAARGVVTPAQGAHGGRMVLTGRV